MAKAFKPKTVATVAILVFVLALAACAPSQGSGGSAGSGSEAEGGKAQTVSFDGTWSMESDCTICHDYEAQSMSDSSLLALTHSVNDCVVCHTEDQIATIHDGVTAPPDEDQFRAIRRNGRTLGTQDFCLRCHGSMEALAEKTVDCTALTDNKGTVVNPHALPQTPQHEEGQAYQCYNCHWIHTSSPTPLPGCTSCHHQGVFECGTCHEVEGVSA